MYLFFFLGLLQGIMSVSIVPKYILISKLNSAIQIRQISINASQNINKYDNDNDNNTNNNHAHNSTNNNNDIDNKNNINYSNDKNKLDKNYSCITLFSGSVQSFHFPSKFNEKILQIRKLKTKKATFHSDIYLNRNNDKENGKKSHHEFTSKNKNKHEKEAENEIENWNKDDDDDSDINDSGTCMHSNKINSFFQKFSCNLSQIFFLLYLKIDFCWKKSSNKSFFFSLLLFSDHFFSSFTLSVALSLSLSQIGRAHV